MIISLRTAMHSITAVFSEQVQLIASPLSLILEEEKKVQVLPRFELGSQDSES